MQSKLIKTNGITLNVMQAGPPDGKLVILLHGFPEFWYGWHHQIDYLAGLGFRVWVPDQRGYNLSDKPEEISAYNVRELAADVAGLIQQAGAESAAIVGHDWGAVVAWTTALLYREKVNKLGILNVPHPQVFEKNLRHNPAQMLKSWYIGLFQIPLLPERLLAMNNYDLAVRMLKSSARKRTFTDEDFEQYRRAWSRPDALRSMIHWYRALAKTGFPPVDDWRIHMPSLIIWGARDVALTKVMAKQSMEYCDDGQLVILEKATHWVQHDEPERVGQILGDFLLD